MKRFIPLLFFVSYSYFSNAQIIDSSIENKNIVKLNLSSLLLKAVSLQYERVLSPRTSVALNLAYRPSDAFNPIFVRLNGNFTKYRLGSMVTTPSFRYYFKRKAPLGFYGELYIRHRRDKLINETNPASNTPFISTGIENILSAGTLFAVQVVKRRDLYIDFWIFGIGAGQTNFTSTSTFSPIYQFQKFEQETKNSYDALLMSTYGNDGQTKWNNDQVTYSVSRPLVTFRAIGFNLGLRF